MRPCIFVYYPSVIAMWYIPCNINCTEILYSWFRASSLYINKIQRDAAVCMCLLTAKLLYMFSGVYRTHHQEYIKL